ncbi:hypothetical protein AB0E11_27555 [Streptomyces fradiae]|uniref:hypothetical protein n=1 Tax=Streptomyces fradiae TaxID=1906 RepID=UPI002943A814|nr:hypothetical protein [Streptomyces fradiae]WOI58642.1 hypothetical protein RYQ63_01080 [Streptomyces fradiae]
MTGSQGSADASGTSESKKAWFFFSPDVPEEQLIIPIKTRHGLAFACRPGGMPEHVVTELNRVARHVVGVGLVTITDNGGEPPDRDEREE